jgi:phosphoserine phosphatase RsbU/P
MTVPGPASSTVRLDELWKRVGAILGSDQPLSSRIAEAAVLATGAQEATLYLRDRDAWIRTGEKSTQPLSPGEIPEPLPEGIFRRQGELWLPLCAEGSVHGALRLLGVSPDHPPEDEANLLAFLLGALVGAHGLARQVREAEFELKARLLELESLYDLGLSLGGQLDLSALADEVLFRSISLTDAGKGSLVLFDDADRVLLERSVGGEILVPKDCLEWTLPEGGLINNEAPSDGMRDGGCRKYLAVGISVAERRLGVLAVADKESRDGRVLDFTPTDARLLSLFANQAAAAIETARLHRDALEKERIERELELASAIQKQLLPRDLPVVAGLEIAAKNVPTRQVGGDYFDFFPLSRGRLAFLVSDVSGKGIPAALLVSTVHAAVHLQIDEAKTVADLISRIDRHLQRFAGTRKFLTCFFGLLEPDTGVLRYVSAGHNPALLWRKSGGIEKLSATGVPMGMFPNASWKEETISLSAGDLLCVYTDGVTEALNSAEEEFGLDRLSRILAKDGSSSPDALCRMIFDEVDAFVADAPQYDDQTLLLARLVG